MAYLQQLSDFDLDHFIFLRSKISFFLLVRPCVRLHIEPVLHKLRRDSCDLLGHPSKHLYFQWGILLAFVSPISRGQLQPESSFLVDLARPTPLVPPGLNPPMGLLAILTLPLGLDLAPTAFRYQSTPFLLRPEPFPHSIFLLLPSILWLHLSSTH